MSRIALACRLFWRALTGQLPETRVQLLLQSDSQPSTETTTDSAVATKPEKRVDSVKEKPAADRSEALTLLATMQREARLVDLVMEPLDEYSDAQVGAAARDVLRQCRTILQRAFDLSPLLEQSEGEVVETDQAADAARFRLVGKVAGDPPYRGKLVHHGWQASQCDIPRWTGGKDSRLIVAPAEIECGS